jgi:protein-L-isoaspartate(D-aspartate) O-methyltransferase
MNKPAFQSIVLYFYTICIAFSWQGGGNVSTQPNQSDPYQKEREVMVNTQFIARGIHDPLVLKAMRTVPRHLFVPKEFRHLSYQDRPLPIGYQQTISQPYMVAFMTAAIKPHQTDRVLEIGTGCGYQAAILAQICSQVFTVEIVEPLAKQAQETLKQLGYTNIHTKIGDGYEGWPEAAPFDAIIVTASCPIIPGPLIQQLKVGGKIIIPLGEPFSEQTLVKGTNTEKGLLVEDLIPVQFVPFTGKSELDSRVP